MRSRHINCQVDLDRVRANAESIKLRTGVNLVGVIKADAYGLGAARVADAIASVVDEFACFSLAEAREVGRPGLVIGPPDGEPAEYRELRLRPTIGTVADARRYAGLPCVVSVDTGMQRFGCEPHELAEIVRICRPQEIHTHAGSVAAIERLHQVAGSFGLPLVAACTAMLDEPRAWLDGVRPGVGLYRGALRVSTQLQSVRETRGPIGYSGFAAPRVGIILGGYSNRIQAAPVLVNGRFQRVLEVGMNSSYVTIDARDGEGDEVVLLGDGLTEAAIAEALNVREHEVMCRYGSMGPRSHAGVHARVGVPDLA